MFMLDRNRIHALAGNDTVYTRGRALHEGKAVLRFHWGENGRVLEADVRDRQTEHVRIRLDTAGMPGERACSCHENDRSGALCRHQVALLLEARERQRMREAYPGYVPGTMPAGPLMLRTLVILPPNPSMPVCVELEIGPSAHTLRPVLDAATFLASWRAGSGKYDPSRFSTAGQRLVDWLAERAAAQPAAKGRGIFAETRAVRLSGRDLPLLLPMAAETGNAWWTDVTRRQDMLLKAVERVLPVALYLDARLHLHLESDLPLVFLNEGCTAFRIENRFIVPDAETVEALVPVLDALRRAKKSTLALTTEEASRFVAERLPAIRAHHTVRLDPAAELLACPAPLEPLVELAWSGRSITAGIRFRYGAWEADPLLTQDTTQMSPLRDRHGEARILGRFRHAGFLPVDGMLALHGDELQYRFLRDDLPVLQADAVVTMQPKDAERFRIMPAPLSLLLRQGETTGRLTGLVRLDKHGADHRKHDRKTKSRHKGRLHPGEIPESALPAMVQSLAAGAAFHRLADGRFLSLESGKLPDLAAILSDPAVHVHPGDPPTLDMPAYRLPAIAALAHPAHGRDGRTSPEQGASHAHATVPGHVELDRTLDAQVRQLSDPSRGVAPPALPDKLAGVLRDYQKTGWRWLATLARFGFGGILADDMGLGKTVQVIALLHTLRAQPELAGMPALIVAPSSLLLNWKAECQKFAPELTVVVMDGTRQEREAGRHALPEADAVVTSYPLLRRDIGELRHFRFSACILDEAQHVKNPETANARAVKGIHAVHRFAVTGTPMENAPTELWSVFDFLMPGCLHTHRQFQARYEFPILKNGDQEALHTLARLVRPFILRRVKQDVLPELPEKIDTLSLCDMTREQRHLYTTFLRMARKAFEEASGAEPRSQGRMRIFALLTRLRQICCDPELVEPGCGAGSGKLDLLTEVLDDALGGGHRVLLFSQFTSMLDRIDAVLAERGVDRMRLDGRTPVDRRLDLVNAFNAGKGRVFLVSLRAGGTGLNLTGADTVIHYDPWWNPAVEDQATDRAHRMGQQSTVQVIRLVTRNSIEEKILKLQERKRSLVDQLVKPGGTFLDALSMEEIRALFDE